MIKVLLVDDHEMVRLGVSSYLSIQDDIEVIGEAENGRVGYEKALELRPDVILMDLVMDEMDGIESTKLILNDWPEAKIIIVTSFIDDEKVYPAIEAGAAGYLLKTSTAHEIAEAIRATQRGERVLEPEVTTKMMDRLTNRTPILHEDLTNREQEVLLLIAVLALIVAWLLGMATMLKGDHYQFQANSVRHKRVLSIIFIGLQMVNDKRIILTRHDVNDAWRKLNESQLHQTWDV